MIIDLHLHSYYSADGSCGIQELLDFFSPGDIVAITDHETIGAWEAFRTEAIQRGLTPILGVEWFSVKCHILSYFLNGIPQEFLEFMDSRRATERHCMYHLYCKLKEKYADLPEYDAVLASAPHPEGVLGLPALSVATAEAARMALIEAEDLVRAMKRRLPEGERPQPFYPEEIIAKINSWGALPALAHPYRNFGGKEGRCQEDEVESLVGRLVQAENRGIEVFTEGSDRKELNHLLLLCERFDLRPVIGSDFHSAKKGMNPASLDHIRDNLKARVRNWLLEVLKESGPLLPQEKAATKGRQRMEGKT